MNQGYEIQIDPTDPASSTGAIYSFQAADRARRDQALRPPGEWNTYEITVDAPRIVVRLNGVVVNRFVSTSAARQSLGRGFVGLQNHSDADRVSFRNVQIKEWGGERPRCAGGPTRRAPSDAFSGARLDGCRWNRIVRYDGGGLEVSGGKLHLELAGGDGRVPPTWCSSGHLPARGRSRRPCAFPCAQAHSRQACSRTATTATGSGPSPQRPAAVPSSGWSVRPGTSSRGTRLRR